MQQQQETVVPKKTPNRPLLTPLRSLGNPRSSTNQSSLPINDSTKLLVVNQDDLIRAACSSGSFNPFDLEFGAYYTAISAGISHDQAPAATRAIIQGIMYDPVKGQVVSADSQSQPEHQQQPMADGFVPSASPLAAKSIAAMGRQVAQDIVCGAVVPDMVDETSPSPILSSIPSETSDLSRSNSDTDINSLNTNSDCCDAYGCDVCTFSNTHQFADASIEDVDTTNCSSRTTPSRQLWRYKYSRPEPQSPRVYRRRRSILYGSSGSANSSFAGKTAFNLSQVFSGIIRSTPIRRMARRPSVPYMASLVPATFQPTTVLA